MNTATQAPTIQIRHNENHLSFAQAFISGKEIFVTNDDKSYELVIVHTAREDGSGNRFLFKAFMKSVILNGNQKHEFPFRDRKNYIGYLDLKEGNGWLKFYDKPIAWKA